jgi:hypothetical protein
MQDIYNYIPETNHVSRVYSVVAVLCLHFVPHIYHYYYYYHHHHPCYHLYRGSLQLYTLNKPCF